MILPHNKTQKEYMPNIKCKWSSSCWKIAQKSLFCEQHKCVYPNCPQRRHSILYCYGHSRPRSKSIWTYFRIK